MLVVSLLIFGVIPLLANPERQRASSHRRQVTVISKGWQFRQWDATIRPGLDAWHPASVPGVVQTDLLANGLIPEPFYRDNESKLQWIGLTNWEYQTSFQVSPATLKHKHIDIVFGGLDTFATVYLNGTKIIEADNMFREWRADVQPHLRAGSNELRILLRSPIREIMLRIKDDPYRLPTVSQVQQVSEDGIATDPYIRKAPYNFGWDWGPRFVTLGIWKPVTLETWDDAKLLDFNIAQNDVSESIARVSANVEIVAESDGTATLTIGHDHPLIKGKPLSDSTTSVEVTLHAGVNRITIPVSIPHPARWYPNGYGPQSLYHFECRLGIGGSERDHRLLRVGLRKLELRRENDQWGKSFEFVVNDIPIFAKGANVIPFDSFPTRVDLKHYRFIMESARDAHMNMVRVWGGGIYESEDFYNLCDELGLMVWQDFMFGGGMYPGDAKFLENVRQEATYQVRRLRNHSSIVLWCGNNEVETAWFSWADRVEYKKNLPPDLRERVWQDYMQLFGGLLREVVAQNGNGIPYWPSTPSSDFEGPIGDTQHGDDHYWAVWHALRPIREYEKQFPRFMSEFGFQSFPQMETVESFTIPSDHDINSPVMLAHQKNKGGNERIREYTRRDYPEAKDFSSFLYLSQVQQAEAIRIGAEHFRRSRPHVMGSLYWQLNDCWPVASWSSIDYNNHWKALHYYARRFYNDLLISPHQENDHLALYVVSDRTKLTRAEIRTRLVQFDGKVLQDNRKSIEIPPLASTIALQIPDAEIAIAGQADSVLLRAELIEGGRAVSTNDYFFVSPREQKLPPTEVRAEILSTKDHYTLKLTAAAFSSNVFVSFGKLSATIGDNYFNLLAGETRVLTVSSESSLDELRENVKIVSLVDAFR